MQSGFQWLEDLALETKGPGTVCVCVCVYMDIVEVANWLASARIYFLCSRLRACPYFPVIYMFIFNNRLLLFL